MRCIVLNCTKTNNGRASDWSFFRFPKEKVLLQKWISFCRRGNTFNPKTSHVCMGHFNSEDFQNNMQYEMGFTKTRLLKRGVFPTIFNLNIQENESLYKDREKRIKKSTNKKIVASLLKEYDGCTVSHLESDGLEKVNDEAEAEEVFVIKTEPIEIDNLMILSENEENMLNCSQDNESISEKEFSERLTAEKVWHSQVEEKYLYEINNLTERLERAEFVIKNMENALATFYTENEIKNIKSGVRKKKFECRRILPNPSQS